MAYLGDEDRRSTWEVGCNGCNRKVRGAEPPKTWLTVSDVIPMEHYCPKCKAARQRKERRR